MQFSGLVALLGGFQGARASSTSPHGRPRGIPPRPRRARPARAADAAGDADWRPRAPADAFRRSDGGRPMRSPFAPPHGAGCRHPRRPSPARAADRAPLLLRGGLSLGALTMLTGCDVSDFERGRPGLARRLRPQRRRPGSLFDPHKLAPEYPASMVLKPPRFNAYYDVEEVNRSTAMRGGSNSPADRRQAALDAAPVGELPEREIIIRHVCVEGWDYIGQWSGVPLRLPRTGRSRPHRQVRRL